MIKEELYHKTVDILVQAYFNDTLEHGNCRSCAVGNLVVANCNIMSQFVEWDEVFCTRMGEQRIFPYKYYGQAKIEIDSTGYEWQQLAKIEKAFESAPRGEDNDEWMFNGLMAVIEILDQIHENTDTELTKQAKNKFIKV